MRGEKSTAVTFTWPSSRTTHYGELAHPPATDLEQAFGVQRGEQAEGHFVGADPLDEFAIRSIARRESRSSLAYSHWTTSGLSSFRGSLSAAPESRGMVPCLQARR